LIDARTLSGRFFVARQAWRVVPQGTVWLVLYPVDDLAVKVVCGPW
jgi:hypothetical protein